MIYDSAERIMMLEHYRFTAQGSWVVLLDATQLERRTGKDESYWPIGITGSVMMSVILKVRSSVLDETGSADDPFCRVEKNIPASRVRLLRKLTCRCRTLIWTVLSPKRKSG